MWGRVGACLQITFQLAQVMSARGCTLRLPIANTVKPAFAKGFITVRGEEIKNCNAKLSITLAGEKLDNKVVSMCTMRGWVQASV